VTFRFRVSITSKNVVSTIATICVIFVSIIAVVATPEQLMSWRWRIVLVGAIAATATIVQMLLQSNEDDKQKEMMTALLRAVVKSEAKTELRLQERAGTELDSTDPRVYVEIEDKRRGSMNPNTPLKLINRGKAPAHHVQIQPLKLHSGEVTFAPLEVLPDDNKPVPVIPEVQKISPLFRHDLTHFLQRDWNDSVGIGGLPTESQYEFVQPMSVTYETYDSMAKFETSFDLVYRVVQDIIQKDWHVSVEGEPPLLEVRNLKFKRLA
jgi:low affinity Fe/Cu permease